MTPDNPGLENRLIRSLYLYEKLDRTQRKELFAEYMHALRYEPERIRIVDFEDCHGYFFVFDRETDAFWAQVSFKGSLNQGDAITLYDDAAAHTFDSWDVISHQPGLKIEGFPFQW